MSNFDFERIWQSKRALHERLTSAPIAEKLRLLDAMRERAVAIRATRARNTATVREEPPPYGEQQ